MDTLLGANNVPDDLVTQCERLTAAAVTPQKLIGRPVRLAVQPQSGDDCGVCVNHIALNLALHGRDFLYDSSKISFDTNEDFTAQANLGTYPHTNTCFLAY